MKEGFEPKSFKTYNLTPEETKELDSFLDKQLAKGYIHPSKSPMASPFFFVSKKDGKLQPCQDYCYLNEWTIKNAYPLPLISKLLNKLKEAKLFTKFDVQWGYNNIWIKKGNEWKAAFKTNKELWTNHHVLWHVQFASNLPSHNGQYIQGPHSRRMHHCLYG